MASQSPQSTNPTIATATVTTPDGPTTTTLSPSIPIKLQSVPHLSDYLHPLQTFPNPLDQNPFFHPSAGFYLSPTSDVVFRHVIQDLSSPDFTSSHLAYHRAGPRNRIFFDPSRVRAAVVTCGGLCPGMNTVIRELVVGLWELYGVREIYGVRAGYRGFYSGEPVLLDPKMVHNWHKRGGTALETSRGGFDLDKIVTAIEDRGYNQVTLPSSGPLFQDLIILMVKNAPDVDM